MPLSTALLVALLPGASSFCTSYSPQPGSRFTFPTKRCLTAEFMEKQFQNGVFGKERIHLADGVSNMIYQGQSIPLILEASLGWESGHTVSAIADIILREILGINTTFACTWGSVHAMKMLGGCSNPMDANTSCFDGGILQLPRPLAHVSVESWVTTLAEVSEMNTYNTNLGMIGYYSKSGLHMDKVIAEDAYRNANVSLEWWRSFVDLPNVADYFDSYADVAEDIRKKWPDGSVSPRCREGDPGFAEIVGLGLTCTDGWFFAPGCAADKLFCVPVILAEYDWNGLVWIQAAVRHGYRFAITWLGSQNWLQYSIRSSKKMLFYCATTSALCYEKPVVKIFTDYKSPVGRPDLITSLLKVVWKQLPSINKRVYDFVSQINIPSDDLQAIMASYSARKAWNDVDRIVPEIACDWLTNKLHVMNVAGESTGANVVKWASWIPRVCSAGHSYDKVLGVCRPCRAGEYSMDGRSCIPCSAGTYAHERGMESCRSCDLGTWQNATRAIECETCPAGTQRRSEDSGCQHCPKGFYTESSRQSSCSRCAIGSWSDEVGATRCIACPSFFTTNQEASSSEANCVVNSVLVFQLSVFACLPLGVFLFVCMLLRWRRHRRQLQEAKEQEQVYFRGAVAVMRTMCSSGVTLRISPDGCIRNADPKDGIPGFREGVRIQDCVSDAQDVNRLNQHLRAVMMAFDEGDHTSFASPFNFSITASNGVGKWELKSFAVALKKDELLMGVKCKKHGILDHATLIPCAESSDIDDVWDSKTADYSKSPVSSSSATRSDSCKSRHGSPSDHDVLVGVLPGVPSELADDETASLTLSQSTMSVDRRSTSTSRRTSIPSGIRRHPKPELHDAEVQTDINFNGARRPPPLPGKLAFRQVQLRSKSKERTRSGSKDASSSREERERNKPPPSGVLKATPMYTVGFMLRESARSIHVESSNACCKLHAALDVVQSLAGDRDKLQCDATWKPNEDWQCAECGALNEQDDETCCVCYLTKNQCC
eukprot:TRINITY_DN27034_c0_g1_i1.p1 TRINITY_DN27034_c0_g1~~TRINITY_DN27034_c0_g1_i1.p1  ORF type:complete len:997 (-),score=81.41 TRINITY_DN27034_c0_g1_i1:206-3196(-)